MLDFVKITTFLSRSSDPVSRDKLDASPLDGHFK
jgi:hypothetical protein